MRLFDGGIFIIEPLCFHVRNSRKSEVIANMGKKNKSNLGNALIRSKKAPTFSGGSSVRKDYLVPVKMCTNNSKCDVFFYSFAIINVVKFL